MQQKYLLRTFLFLSLLAFVFLLACNSSEDTEYTPVSPVSMDLTRVPYPKLSDYKFFEGTLKNLNPSYKVIPYELASGLFTDYALKKRFVWMPSGTKATYDGDGKILKFPVGTALIKTFYYDNVQPSETRQIIETRIMIKKSVNPVTLQDEWTFANYVWNDEQTEAYLDMNGSYSPISWKNENNVVKSSNYRIPSETECLMCHKSNERPIPIGPKPQNLNFSYTYTDGTKNQLAKWVEEGYLESYSDNIVSTVDWKDTSKPLETRVRSYIDANCAHCHSTNSHCDYRPMRFAFSETTNPVNLGICVAPQENIDNSLTYIITKGNSQRSVMHFRMSSVNEATRMPLLGRTIVHEEGVQLIQDWIDSLDPACN
ncbi:hypothetical protein FLJC2902T_23420 [Flavobacterium limnosediminis JC2902]|uniref:Repeat protein (TIGR03806 family) n=1 Tax=Flavobacterium limnosediminis JC2902 TaxID=1341181 RepID=V6SK71_9FLAO|nr:hypothetical protein [Flavobacterium limnosediminis]ESU27001.1 hypothetical protein FLJC2902T_23420 [Flavobacterium limnosediminis JC2902]